MIRLYPLVNGWEVVIQICDIGGDLSIRYLIPLFVGQIKTNLQDNQVQSFPIHSWNHCSRSRYLPPHPSRRLLTVSPFSYIFVLIRKSNWNHPFVWFSLDSWKKSKSTHSFLFISVCNLFVRRNKTPYLFIIESACAQYYYIHVIHAISTFSLLIIHTHNIITFASYM